MVAATGFLEDHPQTNSWELIVHCCNSSLYHCTKLWQLFTQSKLHTCKYEPYNESKKWRKD